MTLQAGTRLGPYEIVSPLGAGGMGEVYRAKDTRLGREVAVKVLPASFSQDADRLRRFEQEARAASALNHPNIVTLHDVGSHDGAPYVVTELLEGETLRSRLATGALSLRKATDYAVQITNGLAAAHEKGIVHRDLKPENLFVTEDGRVKILDFGLAKLMQPEAPPGQQTSIPTASQGTEPGVVMGTAGYMSPEQVKGQSADHRSDIFSFGAILYEMLAGRRAFRGDSAVETMSAILKEDPPELSETNKNLSPELDRLVRHCLEKAPAQRFQSARDLTYDLENVSAISGPRELPPPPIYRIPWLRWIAIAAPLVLAFAVAYAVTHRADRRSADAPLQVRRVSLFRGFPLAGRFAPDGKTVAYAGFQDGKPPEVFLARTDGNESRPLGIANANVLAVSRNGELAVGLRKETALLFRLRSTLASVPLLGGTPRPLAEDVYEADWSPDGKELAVVRSVEGKDVLEFPIGHRIDESDRPLYNPRISPDGKRIAYFKGTRPGTVLLVADADGKKTELVRGMLNKGSLAWHPSGREIWFDLDERHARTIAAVSLNGKRRTVYSGLDWMFIDDISSDGDVLLSRWTVRASIYFRGAGDAQERDLAWLDFGSGRDLSRDGSWLLLEENGVGGGPIGAVYVRRTDGSPAMKIADGRGLAISPAGDSVAVLQNGKLLIYPNGAGEPREIRTGTVKTEHASFFPTDARLRIVGSEPGRERRNWVLDPATGAIRPVTPEAPQSLGVVSSDGRFVAVTLYKDKRVFVFPVGGGDRHEISGTTEADVPLNWTADGRFLYVSRRAEIANQRIERIEVATGAREPWKQIMASDRSGVYDLTGIAITPDGAAYSYTAERAVSGDLFVVEGLK